ncbi:MAG: TIGR04282 family arsenosugar biosynthesis glycosyltransferase [Magnetococcales bacterium]|nr:TIGR04282 family arsenosugar biosynthesis glycosyltransferase [Magnetococcales bacterium]
MCCTEGGGQPLPFFATHLILFAKAPTPGLAKTRLIPALGSEGAAALARNLFLHTVDVALLAGFACLELSLTPAATDTQWQEISLPAQVILSDQGEGDLGERMARAARRATLPMLLIGTDCLEMSVPLLHEAAHALQQHQAVIYPSADGGYALLGLQRFHPSLFQGVHWSTSSVAAETLQRIHTLRWSLFIGPTLHDLDRPEDLPTFFAR